MPQINKININGTEYDLPGGAGITPASYSISMGTGSPLDGKTGSALVFPTTSGASSPRTVAATALKDYARELTAGYIGVMVVTSTITIYNGMVSTWMNPIPAGFYMMSVVSPGNINLIGISINF